MHNTWSTLLPMLCAISLSTAPASAQPTQPTDSLGGKTVHVFLRSQVVDTLAIQNLNITMKKDAPYWYSYTFTKAGLYDYQDGFYFTDPSHRIFFSKSGLGLSEAPRFLLADFAGTKEIWIIADPSGPSNVKPIILTTAPKMVNILNPWPATAPKLVSGTKTVNMTTVSGHCGWFSAMLLDTTLTKGHFAEMRDAEPYGKSGFGSAEDFDFAALFAQYGSTIWLNTDANSWTAAFPNVEGTCQYVLAMTVRDFSKNHPDFDFGAITGDHLLKSMVLPVLGTGPGRKPLLNPAPPMQDPTVTFSHFDEWWITDSTRADPYKNYESCSDLPMGKSSDGRWEYDSYGNPDHGFWPVEGAGLNRFNETTASCYAKPPPDSTMWVTGGPQRNGNFCAESHATFVYTPGQTFSVRGSDDVWVFINDKLVIDLGGVHVPASDSVDLDKLGLTANKTYNWDFFKCNRQPCGSALRIKTPIFFKQPLALYGIVEPGPNPGSIEMEIWKRAGGNGSCAPVGGNPDSVKASHLTYQLLDAAGNKIRDLANPGNYLGGITIAEPMIAVDTAKLIADSSLIPGAAYRVVAFETANPTLQVGITFRTRPESTGLSRARIPAEAPRTRTRYRNLLGRRISNPPSRSPAPLIPQQNPAH